MASDFAGLGSRRVSKRLQVSRDAQMAMCFFKYSPFIVEKD